MATAEAKKPKAPNWTEEETLQLVQEVELRKHIINKKFSKDVTTQTKRKAWEEVTLVLNSRFPHHHRSQQEVKKRWDNVCTRMRRQYSEIRKNMNKTGEKGQVVDIPPVMSAVLDVIGAESAGVIGIAGGIDSAETPEELL
ncbi:myb/SANT-like DNA-binding domain-containing protein 4 [Ornithodoros turicata]|uniref:myb/SANT-like DNA-binding domain-containing protein 4 n=1 Tax=Ornithodoros turicata TaxID=34597 RepID=UPI003139D1B9